MANLSEKTNFGKNLKSQIIQKGLQKPGHQSEGEAQGQQAGGWESMGILGGVGTFGFETLSCAFGLMQVAKGSWEAGQVGRLPHHQGTCCAPRSEGPMSHAPLEQPRAVMYCC